MVSSRFQTWRLKSNAFVTASFCGGFARNSTLFLGCAFCHWHPLSPVSLVALVASPPRYRARAQSHLRGPGLRLCLSRYWWHLRGSATVSEVQEYRWHLRGPATVSEVQEYWSRRLSCCLCVTVASVRAFASPAPSCVHVSVPAFASPASLNSSRVASSACLFRGSGRLRPWRPRRRVVAFWRPSEAVPKCPVTVRRFTARCF